MCSPFYFVFFRWLILVSILDDASYVLTLYSYTFNKRPCASSPGFYSPFRKKNWSLVHAVVLTGAREVVIMLVGILAPD
jgi:hypothetical protein